MLAYTDLMARVLLLLGIFVYFIVIPTLWTPAQREATPRWEIEEMAATGGPTEIAHEDTREEEDRPHDERAVLVDLAEREAALTEYLSLLDTEQESVRRERQALTKARDSARERGHAALAREMGERLTALANSDQGITQARDVLASLTRDREQFERLLRQSLAQEEESRTFSPASLPRSSTSNIAPSTARSPSTKTRKIARSTGKVHELSPLSWPVSPMLGISATFRDPSYSRRFRRSHEGIDIPVGQGTQIRAPADGFVDRIADNGLGYSFIRLIHDNGLVTLYGHVSGTFVSEGQRVRRGDTLGLTGGRPGSRGAGLLTTGPHLHLEVFEHGTHTDPLKFLSPVRVALAEET